MEWLMRFVFKLMLFGLLVFVGFSIVRQLFSPVERPTVMAGPGGRLPAPLPEKGAGSGPD
jgi:hypothetical protein